MGLRLIVEVMSEIGKDRIPAGVLGSTSRTGIFLVPVIGLQDEGITVVRLERDERAYHQPLGLRIAPGT